MAAWTSTAFSKLFSVTICRAVTPSRAIWAALAPAFWATWRRSSQVAGIKALPGSISPRASAMICMVEAVPIKEQARRKGRRGACRR